MVSHRIIVATLVMLCHGLIVDHSRAQHHGAAQRTEPNLRVVDLTYIFKHHAGFQADVKEMKQEVAETEERLQEKVKEIKTMNLQLELYDRGTDARQKLEDEISRRKSEFKIQANRKKAEFLERESEIYHKHYQRIQNKVSVYCEKNNVSLVLRFNREDKSDKLSRADRLRAMNRPVVYQRNIDITQAILDALEQHPDDKSKPEFDEI
jgi:Skp family chaperone for outer membrane proteins